MTHDGPRAGSDEEDWYRESRLRDAPKLHDFYDPEILENWAALLVVAVELEKSLGRPPFPLSTNKDGV